MARSARSVALSSLFVFYFAATPPPTASSLRGNRAHQRPAAADRQRPRGAAFGARDLSIELSQQINLLEIKIRVLEKKLLAWPRTNG